VVGFLITMTAARPTVLYVVVGYCLFRIFDIFKPWPCRSIHRMLEGGPGIVLDDVVAGVYAGVILYFLGRYFSL
jgi:phosphatidylglycerophosphatase A